MTRTPHPETGLSDQNQALFERIWREGAEPPRQSFLVALNRLMDTLREEAFRHGWDACKTGYGPDDVDGALRAYRIGWRPGSDDECED